MPGFLNQEKYSKKNGKSRIKFEHLEINRGNPSRQNLARET